MRTSSPRFRQLRADRIALALLATFASYLLLTGYDRVGAAVRRRGGAAIESSPRLRSSRLRSPNNAGFGVLTGGAVRMRLYGAAGVEAGLVSRAIAFMPQHSASASSRSARPGCCGVRLLSRRSCTSRRWRCARSRSCCLRPCCCSCCARRSSPAAAAGPRSLAAAAEHRSRGTATRLLRRRHRGLRRFAVVPSATGRRQPPVFVGFYSLAVVLGMISHVPGGLGVFESVLLVALAGDVPAEGLAGALVLYRLIYYVLPLALALTLLTGYELRRAHASPIGSAAVSLSPLLLAAFTFAVGVMLLVSGATPATDEATTALGRTCSSAARRSVALPRQRRRLELAARRARHVLASRRGVVGRRGHRGVASFRVPKGVAVRRLRSCSFLLVALALSREQFTRKADLLAGAFSRAGSWA